jgi:hypothetical protein
MSINLKVRREEPIEEGSCRAVLKSLEKKNTTFGERAMWLFWNEEHNAEVAGFTSLSESTQANAFQWAVALNPQIAIKSSWGSEDVVGKECILKLEVVQGTKGPKNKIVEVLPLDEEEEEEKETAF